MADIIDVNIGDQVLEVYWQDEVELNLDMALMYIKSGQKEIQDYVDNVSKPEIDNYIKTEAKPIVAEVVNTIAEPLVNEYIETTTKPAIDEYVDELKPDLQAYVTQAQGFASNSQISAEASATSAAAALVSANNASESATTASGYAINAQDSATSSSNYASNSQASANSASESAQNAAQSAQEAADSAALAIAKSSFGNIGDIKYTSRTDVPNGGAWCDGALYTKAQFPDVYQMLVEGKIQSTTVTDFDSKVSANGSCGFFGLDTSNERFKVPLLKDVYIKSGHSPLSFGAESLPNITGELFWGPQTGITSGIDIPKGAFYGKTSKSNFPLTNPGQAYTGGFDASRSSSTYQDGAKVNPDHVVYRAYVVLYASAAEASVAQAAEFMTALGGKANVDMDNLSADGKQLISGLGLPSERYIDMSLQNSGATYTAPANGWVEFAKSSNAADQYVSLEGRLGFRCYVPSAATNAVLSMPVRKGEVFTAYYSCGGKLNRFRFYYTEGEK